MSRHLVDDVTVGWNELGTDLLDDAPPALVHTLTGGERWPSRTLDHLVTPDGSPLVRMAVTDDTAGDMDVQWGYVLHPQGIEVISMAHTGTGPLVAWDTDPRTPFSDHPAHWPAITTHRTPTALRTPPRPTARAAPTGSRTALRR